MARKGNERIDTDSGKFAGVGHPVHSGPIKDAGKYQGGMPVGNTLSKQVNASCSHVPGKVHEVEPDWGPHPAPSDPA